jgi:hypothetical protein
MVHRSGISAGRIVTVTPNPGCRHHHHIQRLKPGHGHRVRPLVQVGGKGVNIARVAHQLGHRVLAVAPVGRNNGVQFRGELALSAVPHRLVAFSAETRRSIAVVETAEDRTTILNELGVPSGD